MFEIAKSKVIAAGAGLALIFTGIGGVAVAGAASSPSAPAPLAVTQSVADQTGEQIDSENVDATPDVNETAGTAETAEAPDGAADVETADGVGDLGAPNAGTQVMPAPR